MNSRLRILRVSFFLLIFFLSLFSAYSKSKRAAATDADAPETLTVAPAVNGKLKLSAAEKKLIKEQKKAEAAELKKRKKLEKQSSVPIKVVGMLGGDGVFQAKTMENTVGNIKVLVKGTVGSFQLYSLDRDGVAFPVLAGHDEFTSSFFSLRVGKKEYRLTDNIGIVIGARKDDTGAQLIYVVPDVARVHVKFECLKSDLNGSEDILKVTVSVKNIGKKAADFALKNVLDTILGEQSISHFSTAENVVVNTEMQFRRFDKAKWIISENKKTSMQILIYGADITPMEAVSLSNKDLLLLQNWIPSVIQSRTFDSVLSYNNSAVALNWEPVHLSQGQETSFVYYIAFASDGTKPAGEKFIDTFGEKLVNTEDSQSEALQKDDDSVSENSSGADSAISQPEKTNVDFNPDLIPPEKINYEYVRKLLERIDALENDAEKVNREEILNLNAELDAIMEILRLKE